MTVYVIYVDTKDIKDTFYNVLETREEAERDLKEAKKMFPKGYAFRIEEMKWKVIK